MNFEDESYVRLYVKRTHTNRALRWDGRMVMHEMMYEFDRAGVFEFTGDLDEAIETMTGIPLEHVRAGLARLLKLQVWTVVRPYDAAKGESGVLFWPPWLHAQTCKRSEAARKRDSRASQAAAARAGQLLGEGTATTGQDVTERDAMSHKEQPADGKSQPVTAASAGGTPGHDSSRSVTLCSADPLLPSAPPTSDAGGREGNPTSGVQTAGPPPLEAKAQAYVRDPFRVGIDVGPPETWPEVIAAAEVFQRLYPESGRLRPRDSRAVVIVERFAQGYTLEQLAAAAEGSRLDRHFAANPQHQAIPVVWRDENQVNRFMALLKAGGSTAPTKPRALRPTQHGVDLEARRAQRLAAAANGGTE